MDLGKITRSNRNFNRDLVERALSTFWQGAAAVLIASNPTTNWSELRQIGAAAAIGGVASLLSVAKSNLVRYRGVENSASANNSV